MERVIVGNKEPHYKRQSFPAYFSHAMRDIYTSRYAFWNFVKTNIQKRYRRSLFGVLWSFISPLLTMAVTTVVFALLFQVRLKEFSIYLYSGLVPWGFISSAVIEGCVTFISSEGYLKKIYVPKLLFPAVTVTTQLIFFLISMSGYFVLAIFLGIKVSIYLIYFPFIALLTYLFVFGISLVMSIAVVFHRDLYHITQILMSSALFYATPILYDIQNIPENFQWLFYLNPVYYFIDIFHAIFSRAEAPGLETWVACIGLSLISFLFGLFVLARNEKEIIFRL